MADVRITKKEALVEGKNSLTRYSYERTAGGNTQRQTRDIFHHGNAATVLLYNPEKRTLILTRQFRLATFVNGNPDGMLTETPAGLLEEGEAPEKTMLREIKEETGYAVEGVQKLFEAYSSAGAFTELLHFYAATYTDAQKESAGGGLKEEGEEVDVVELPFADALRKLEAGEIRDLKTITLLQYAQVKGLL